MADVTVAAATVGTEALKRLEEELAAARAEVQVVEGERNKARSLSKVNDKAIEAYQRDLAKSEDQIADLKRQLATIELESAGHQEEVQKAYEKMKADDAVVEKAKEALASALTLLGEREGGK